MVIRNSVIEILKRNNIEWEDSYDFLDLATVGVDSLLFIQLIVEIEEKFGFEFNDEDLNASLYKSMSDFLQKIHQYLSGELSG